MKCYACGAVGSVRHEHIEWDNTKFKDENGLPLITEYACKKCGSLQTAKQRLESEAA